jgi:hypothetical protein
VYVRGSLLGRKHTAKVSRGLFRADVFVLERDVLAAEPVTQETIEKFSSGVAMGLAGGMLLGPAGLLGGVLLGRRTTKKNKITFACVFRNGERILAIADTRTWEAFHAAAFNAGSIPLASLPSIEQATADPSKPSPYAALPKVGMEAMSPWRRTLNRLVLWLLILGLLALVVFVATLQRK